VPVVALRIVIADRDPLARRLLRDALEAGGMAVVAEARSAAEAVDAVDDHAPDVLVLGADLDAVRRLAHATRVVVLARDEDESVALRALRDGACGFLSKEIDVTALPRALAGVAAGEAAISRRLERRLIERVRRLPDGTMGLRPIKGPLTAREWEIVDLLEPGHTTDTIARTLVISVETVRSHVKSIMRKLEVHSRGDARVAAERLRAQCA
jgi:two-component system, NarL family, response regulator LiaR